MQNVLREDQSKKTPLITFHFYFKPSGVAIYSAKRHKYNFYHRKKLMLWIVNEEYCGVVLFCFVLIGRMRNGLIRINITFITGES